MVSPPRMVTKHLDNGPGLDENIREFADARRKVIKRVKNTAQMVINPSSTIKQGATSKYEAAL
jgi:hypothetical protein